MKKICLTFFCLMFINNSYAFTLSNSAAAAFAGDRVTIDVASHNCSNIGMSNQQLLDAANEAAEQYWNDVPTSRLRLAKGGLRSVSSLFQTDVICVSGTDCTPTPALVVSSGILISCNNNSGNFSSGGVLSVTVPNSITGRIINGALILINDRSDNQFQNKSHAEQVSILAHEIGHAIGLGHSAVEDSLMYYRSISTRRALGQDDIDGVSYLYPTEQPIKGCGSIALIDSSDENGINNNKKIWHQHGANKKREEVSPFPQKNTAAILAIMIGMAIPYLLSKCLKISKKYLKYNFN